MTLSILSRIICVGTGYSNVPICTIVAIDRDTSINPRFQISFFVSLSDIYDMWHLCSSGSDWASFFAHILRGNVKALIGLTSILTKNILSDMP